MDESFRRLSSELAKVEQGQLKAFQDRGKVILVIQNAPDELRKLADALERINISEIQALVAYDAPKPEPRAVEVAPPRPRKGAKRKAT